VTLPRDGTLVHVLKHDQQASIGFISPASTNRLKSSHIGSGLKFSDGAMQPLQRFFMIRSGCLMFVIGRESVIGYYSQRITYCHHRVLHIINLFLPGVPPSLKSRCDIATGRIFQWKTARITPSIPKSRCPLIYQISHCLLRFLVPGPISEGPYWMLTPDPPQQGQCQYSQTLVNIR
jgi:hypothetical protein